MNEDEFKYKNSFIISSRTESVGMKGGQEDNHYLHHIHRYPNWLLYLVKITGMQDDITLGEK